MSKKKRLGRGLEALLGVGSKPEDNTKSSEPESPTPSPEFQLDSTGVEIDSIDDLKSADESPASELEEPTILKFSQDPSKKKSASKIAAESKVQDSKPSPTGGVSATIENAQDDLELEDVRLLAKKATADASDEPSTAVVELNVYDVDDNPFQPRREFNKSEIESLAESLKTHEQLQPILVRRMGDRYQLISGERRLRAAIHAGWSKIRAQVREADDRLVAELAIVENLQRKDLNPVEKALSFRRYIDEHGCSQEDLAGRLKIDRSTVANLLRLLELPSVVQKALQVGLISNGHARALLPLGEEHLQIEFCNRIQREGLSVRATEQLVRDKIDVEDGVKKKSAAKSRTKNNQILSLEKELRNALGTKTEIKPASRGKGKIVVHYSSREEFERLRQFFTDSDDSRGVDAA